MEVIEKPSLIVHPHALVGDGTTHTVAGFLPGETLGAYIERTGVIVPAGPVIVWHNGHRVPDALWRRLIPRNGDQVIIRARVLGGGGGNKVLRTVAMIALIVVANVYGPAVGAALGFTGTAAAGVGTALIMVGGSLLINALLPPPKPTAAQLTQGAKYESSPTYAISGGRNRMRPYEPMLLIFGRHKVVPDLGAQYYTQYVGDDQYLNQVFHLGLQNWAVSWSDIKIGDTPIENYQGVQLQTSHENASLPMFPGNVDTLQGFVLASGVVNSRTTPLDTTHISIELVSQLFIVGDDGAIGGRTVDMRVQFRPVGGTWTDIGMLTDAVYATHYWSLRTWGTLSETQVEFGSMNYADHTDGEMVDLGEYEDCSGEYCVSRRKTYIWRWMPHPYQLGQPWHGVAPDPLLGYSSTPGVRLWNNRQEPVRGNVSWDVPKGQYEIRIWKVTPDVKNSRESNETAVNQILCFQPDTADYGSQLRMALRIKASEQLSGAVDEFNLICYGWCSVWNGSSWVWQHSRNPAWWFLHFAIGRRKDSGERLYGAGMTTAQIDYDAIKAWGAWCDAKSLTFDYVLDRKIASAEMLQIIARAGRASPTWQTGKLGVVWDAADQPAVAMFGPFNIKAGSFKVDYISEGTVDEIVLNFVSDQTWQMDEVRVKVPGAVATNNPLQLDFDGCTSSVMAGREANLIAASQLWHRRRITWETDIEGWVAGRGDVVQFSHDLTVWGYSGRLLARSGNQITLSQKLPSGWGAMMFRGPEGQMRTIGVTAGVDTDTVTLSGDMTGFPLPGDAGYENVPAMDWAFFFDPLGTPGRRFKITEVAPTQDGVRFTAIDDDPGYYASEWNPYQYVPPRDGALLAGMVFSISFAEGWYNTLSGRLNLFVDWVVSSSVAVDVVVTVNGRSQAPLRTTDRKLTIPDLKQGDKVTVSVTPAGTTKGVPLTRSYTVQAVAAPPAAITGMTAAVDGAKVRLAWRASPEPDVVRYEVRSTDTGWGAIGALFVGDAAQCLVDPPPAGQTGTWYARSVNAAGLYAGASTSASLAIDVVTNVASIAIEFADTSLTNAVVTLSWTTVAAQLGTRGYRVTYDAVTQDVDATRVTLPADWIGDRSFRVQTLDNAGNVSSGTVSTVTKLVPAAPTGLRAQVIDNNVLLYWTLPAATTLPVDHVYLKEGADWVSARDIGSKKGSFTSLAELEAGRKTYWLRTVDTDGWQSDAVSIAVDVAQPPDFLLRGKQQSLLTGELTMAYKAAEGVYLPVNASETWQAHFTSRSWAGPQDQISAGYPYFLQPTPTPGVYQEVFDFGTIVPSSRVTVTMEGSTITGEPIVSTTVATSQDGTTWSAPTNGLEVFATTFRYVRFTVTVSQAADKSLYLLSALTVTLSSKLKNDAGLTSAQASDALGTIANFSIDFLDVSSITLSPAGTVPRVAVYDFKDAALAGTYSTVSGVVTVNVTGHGLIAGQDVMLNYANQIPERVRVVTASVNSFTANVPGPNKSGNLQIYAQSCRIYLFDQAGARVSGEVSWAVKGN